MQFNTLLVILPDSKETTNQLVVILPHIKETTNQLVCVHVLVYMKL